MPGIRYNMLMHQQPLHPAVVLGVVAHADDLECNAGGTLAKFARDGADVYCLVLTDGCKGTADRTLSSAKLARLRQEEQRAAAKTLGAKDVFFGTYEDGGLENSRVVRRDIVKMIRHLKPDTVITWDPSMLYCARRGMINHADHRAAGQATLDALYPLARDHASFPELLEQGYEPHKTATVLLINFTTPNYFVDIADTMEQKKQAIATYVTQMHDIAKAQALFVTFAEEDAALFNNSGLRYAETFVRIDIS